MEISQCFVRVCGKKRYQQQPVSHDVSSGGSVQQHELFRPRNELITAAAQPTPTFTVIAPKGQFR